MRNEFRDSSFFAFYSILFIGGDDMDININESFDIIEGEIDLIRCVVADLTLDPSKDSLVTFNRVVSIGVALNTIESEIRSIKGPD